MIQSEKNRFLQALRGWAVLSLSTALFGSALLTTGCASSDYVPARTSQRDMRAAVQRAGLAPDTAVLPGALTDEMLAWLHETVPPMQGEDNQLETLLDLMLDERFLAIRYQSGYTPTAEEVFDQRTANCLGFTHLFVSMSRELGIPAYFLDVDRIQRFERDEDQSLVIASGHVTAGYGIPSERLILEFNVGPEADYRTARKVDDVRALAMYYSNRGAEQLRDGDIEPALEWLRTAVALDPGLPDAWINYGVALRRFGDESAAEEAYFKALDVDPHAVTAYHNLAALMHQRGREVDAQELLRVADHLGQRNPYSYINLGDMHLRQGEIEQAERFYRKALSQYGDLPDPYAALGTLALVVDERDQAQRWLRRAQRRDPRNPRVLALDRRLNPSGLDDPGSLARLVPAERQIERPAGPTPCLADQDCEQSPDAPPPFRLH